MKSSKLRFIAFNTLQMIPSIRFDSQILDVSMSTATGLIAVATTDVVGDIWEGTIVIHQTPFPVIPIVSQPSVALACWSCGVSSVCWLNETGLLSSHDDGSLQLWMVDTHQSEDMSDCSSNPSPLCCGMRHITSLGVTPHSTMGSTRVRSSPSIANRVITSGKHASCALFLWDLGAVDPTSSVESAMGGDDGYSGVNDICWCPTDASASVFSSAGDDGYVRVWDTRVPSSDTSVGGIGCVSAWHINQSGPVLSLSWAGGDRDYAIAVGGYSNELMIYDLRAISMDPIFKDSSHVLAGITAVSFCPESPSVVASGATDGMTLISNWSLPPPKATEYSPQHWNSVTCLAWKSESYVYSGGFDRRLCQVKCAN